MKQQMIIWVAIVILVIGALIYLTVRGEKTVAPASQVSQVEESMTKEENTQNVSGVEITILKEGTGEPVVVGDVVAMNYTGTLSDGTAFDSNVDPKFNHVEPFVFRLGDKTVIEGWEIGVLGMKVGEKRKLVINPENAYGATGVGGAIPPNATLTFEIELVAVQK